jgi:hypothetical protein
MEIPVNSLPFPPILEILVIVLGELLFGMGYNRFFEWARIPAAYAVVFGVAATIGLPLVFWWDAGLWGWQWALLALASFAGSGAPMVWGFIHRRNANSHQARAWPNKAARVRDEVIMELAAIGQRTEDAGLVRKCHELIGMLRSV